MCGYFEVKESVSNLRSKQVGIDHGVLYFNWPRHWGIILNQVHVFSFISIMDFGVRPEICLAMGQKRPKKCLIMLNSLQKIGPIMLMGTKNRPNDA